MSEKSILNRTTRNKRFGRIIMVTEKDISKAIPKSSTSCMIADGVKHSLPDVKAVNVDLATIRFTDKKTGDRYTYSTPSSVQDALVQFDAGNKPTPFQFRLRTLFQVRPKANIARKTPTRVIIEEEKPGEHGIIIRAPIKVGGRTVPRAVLGHTRRFGRMTFPTKLEEPSQSVPLPSVLISGDKPK